MKMSDTKYTDLLNIDSSSYCSAVAEELCFDNVGENGQKKIDFRKLFYPANIGEGSYAVKNYAEVMSYVDSSDEIPLTERERIRKLRRQLDDSLQSVETQGKANEQLLLQMQRTDELIYRLKKWTKKDDDKSAGTKVEIAVPDSSASNDSVKTTQASGYDADEASNATDMYVRGTAPSEDTVVAIKKEKVDFDALQGSSVVKIPENRRALTGHLILESNLSRVLLLASGGYSKKTL